MQVLVRRCPAQPMQRGQITRREFEYKRDGMVTFLTALNVYDGPMWGCCLEANDYAHLLGALGWLTRRYPWARRLHLILDNGSSHIAHEIRAYFARHPRLRAYYTPPHASWLNQAELLRDCFILISQVWGLSMMKQKENRMLIEVFLWSCSFFA